ncbi:unnamed protein product [Rhizophagus irregularis]|nr:unnamed protein product [Rhizophagus irregularis]CAB4414717.1 unnamed protein product [Rhizophagus irregularis]
MKIAFLNPNWCQDLSRELAIGLALILNMDIIDFLLLISPTSTLFPFAWIIGHYIDINDLDKANSTRRIHNLIWH